MLKNLLKYGIVILAMIASTGLLWADGYVEVVHDTCFVEKLDSLHINLSVQQAVNACCESESEEEAVCWFTKMLQYSKEYKKDILFVLTLSIVLLLLLKLGFKQISYRKKNKSEKKKLNTKDIERLCVVAFAAVCLWLDSTWFYLILASILLYYVDKWEICPELLAGIANIIKLLQGKLDISNQTEEDQKQELKKEAEQEYEQVVQEEPDGIHKMQSKEVWIRQRMSDGERVENLALDWYEKQYPALQRNVRIRQNPKSRIDLDGLFVGEDRNVILDIRYCTHNLRQILNFKLDYLYEAANYLRQRTGHVTSIIICVVVGSEKQKRMVHSYFEHRNSKGVELQVYTEEELQKLKGK